MQWVDPDYLVFAQEGVLVAQRFDLASGRIVGPPISIAEPVDHFLSTGRAMFTTSRNGTIAYHSYANVARLVWIDRTGKEVGTVGAPGNYLNVRLSPDGGTALFRADQAWNRHVGPLYHRSRPERRDAPDVGPGQRSVSGVDA